MILSEIWFALVGLSIGGALGVVVMALLAMGKEE